MDKDGSSAMPQNPPFSSPDSSSEPVLTGTPASTPNFFANSSNPDSSAPSTGSTATPETAPSSNPAPVTSPSSNSDRARHLFGGHTKHNAQAAPAPAAGPSLIDNTPDFFKQAANANETVVTLGGGEPEKPARSKKPIIIGAIVVAVLLLSVGLVVLAGQIDNNNKKNADIALSDSLTREKAETINELDIYFYRIAANKENLDDIMSKEFRNKLHSEYDTLETVIKDVSAAYKANTPNEDVKDDIQKVLSKLSSKKEEYAPYLSRYDELYEKIVNNKAFAELQSYSDIQKLEDYLDTYRKYIELKSCNVDEDDTCLIRRKNDYSALRTKYLEGMPIIIDVLFDGAQSTIVYDEEDNDDLFALVNKLEKKVSDDKK